MAKAKLATVTEKWIDGKTESGLAVKGERQQDSKKVKQTFYLSKEAAKLLWHNRAETREPISHVIERLVMKHLGGK